MIKLGRKTLGASIGVVSLLASAAYADSAQPAVYGESATVKVMQDAAAKPNQPLTLAGARNEFVSFQVVIQGGSAGVKGVSAKLDALSGPSSIQGNDLTLYREAYLDIKHPTDPSSKAGEWPDGLIPDVDPIAHEHRNAFPFDVPANQARAIWVDVHIPDGAQPGTYQGQVDVSGDGVSQSVPISLQVLPATLPSTSSLPSAYLLFDGNVCRAHTGKNDCGSQQKRDQLVGEYEQLALDHRITLSNIGQITGDWSHYDALLAPYMEGSAPTQLQGAKMTSLQFTGKRQADVYQAFASHLSSNGWLGRAYDYTGDEPPYGTSYSTIAQREQLVKQAAPELARLVTTNVDNATQHGILDGIDTMVPVINQMDGVEDKYKGDQRSKYDQFLSGSNKKLWLYQSCMSHGCGYGTNSLGNSAQAGWPSYAVDTPATRNRAMQWEIFLENATGELYYETANMLPSAWSDQYSFGGNGDGTLFYPGTPAKIGGTTDVPVPSIRLELIREGMQDYEWLKLVSDAGDPDFARQVANGLLPSASQVPTDGSAFDAARAKLEQRYLDLTGQGGGTAVPSSPVAGGGGSSSANAVSDAKGCGSGPGGAPTAAAGLMLPLFLFRRRRRRE